MSFILFLGERVYHTTRHQPLSETDSDRQNDRRNSLSNRFSRKKQKIFEGDFVQFDENDSSDQSDQYNQSDQYDKSDQIDQSDQNDQSDQLSDQDEEEEYDQRVQRARTGPKRKVDLGVYRSTDTVDNSGDCIVISDDEVSVFFHLFSFIFFFLFLKIVVKIKTNEK